MDMIKKFIYILTLVALLCSCVKEEVGDQFADDQIGVEHNGKVTLGFNVEILDGISTKSLSETPDIQNIYVAVFDASGYKLSEYVKANPITTGPENDHKYQFTVELKTSDKQRTLHFIANGPKELRFGTEQEVIGELFTRYNADESDEYTRKDSYWQRLVFNKISPRPEGTDDGSQAWQDYNSMVETLRNLKLIRNFSKITLSKKTPVAEDSNDFKNFQILGMWFVNYPDRGSVAPYNRNTGLFGTERLTYLDYNNMYDVEDKTKGNYQGFTLASTEFITPESFMESGADKNMISAVSNTAYGYVYEREKALKSPMYLIIKCNYKGADTYYKIAMQDEEGNFYAMLRNFNYTVQIQDVSAAGYPTAKEALEGAPTGDISVNVDYQDLPNISDGNARITVSATKLVIVGQEGHTASSDFWYKYEPDITVHGDTGVHNDLATGTEATDKANPHVLITYEGTEGSTGAVIDNISVATANDGGNRHVTINTTAASATPKIQTITIEGRRWDGFRYKTITRTIQLVLRNALEMTLTASPNTDSENDANVLAQTGRPVVLHIGIEKDLPTSMFPLYFSIDPSVNSLTPDNAYSDMQELPVRYGTDANGRPVYWFEKAVSWTEYEAAPVVNGKKEIPVYFTTILTDNATEIEVSNEYFATGSVKVKNYTPKTFSNLAFSGSTHKVGQEETFSFSMSEVPPSGKVLVAMKGIEPASLTDYTYLGKDANGYWLYELAVSSTNIGFNVIPYMEGSVGVKLSSLLFNDASVNVSAIDPDSKVYVNADGTGSGTSLKTFISSDVNDGGLVVGQHVTLAFYIISTAASSSDVVSVTDNNGTSYTASRITSGAGATVNIDGNTFNKYTVTYTVPAEGGDISKGYDNLFKVYVKTGSADPAVKGSFSMPVYGIKLGDKLTSVSFDTDKYYVIQNNSTGRYLYNNETNNSTGILKTAYDFSSLVKFGNTASASNVAFVKIDSKNQYYLGSSSYNNVALSTTQYDWTITDTFRFSHYRTAYYGYYYAYDNSGTLAMSRDSSTNANRYWNIYPVSFVAPAL